MNEGAGPAREGEGGSEEAGDETELAGPFRHRMHPGEWSGSCWCIGVGHPTNEVLARMLRLGEAQDVMIRAAEQLQCSVCQLGSRPRRPFAAKAESRAVSFGTCVHIDLKYEHTISVAKPSSLSVLWMKRRRFLSSASARASAHGSASASAFASASENAIASANVLTVPL